MASKTFGNVTETMWQCVKTNSEKQHGTQYVCSDPAGNNCKATTSTKVGDIVLQCVEDPNANTLTYTIVSKPWVVPESTIWSGASDALKACGWNG